MGVDLHGRVDAQPSLETGEIVVSDILPDHLAQLLPAGEAPAIVSLPLENAPEALHGSVVNTLDTMPLNVKENAKMLTSKRTSAKVNRKEDISRYIFQMLS